MIVVEECIRNSKRTLSPEEHEARLASVVVDLDGDEDEEDEDEH